MDNATLKWLDMARVDIKNRGEGNDVIVTVIEGEKCDITKPRWFSKCGTGYLIETSDKHVVLELECCGAGEITICLRGIDRNIKAGQRLPLWIDYTGFVVDGNIIFDEKKPVCHDKFYKFTQQVSDGRKFRVEISWEPHGYKGEELTTLVSSLIACSETSLPNQQVGSFITSSEYVFQISGKDLLQMIPVAVQMNGGLDDTIVLKRKLEEILKWDKRIVLDIYATTKRKDMIQSFFKGEYEDRINSFIWCDDQNIFAKQKGNYAIAFWFPQTVDMEIVYSEGKLRQAPNLLERCMHISKQSDAYGHIKPLTNAIHYARCEKDGLSNYTSLNRYDGFAVDDWHTHIPMLSEYEASYRALGLADVYVTVNYGFGFSPVDGRIQHKAWPKERFDNFVELFKHAFPSVQVVQVGSGDFPDIIGCDKYVMGESLELVKYVLQGSFFHIDIEGGLVHLATQLGTRCVVLFGPTPLHYYGYPENVNIQAGNCHDCCWYTGDWYTCYRRMAEPECMYSITPEMVMAQVEKHFGAKLREAEGKLSEKLNDI